MKSAASKAGASTVPPPAKIGDRRLRTIPPTWKSGIMLKQTSFVLKPQEAMTHTAPTASVSKVYETVFFLPLRAHICSSPMPFSGIFVNKGWMRCCLFKGETARCPQIGTKIHAPSLCNYADKAGVLNTQYRCFLEWRFHCLDLDSCASVKIRPGARCLQ